MTAGVDDVARRMEAISGIFKHAQSISENTNDFSSLALLLDQTENEYRSVAYEAASMSIALSDFEYGTALNRWQDFKNGIGKRHASQVHAGLGWAIAQKRISISPLLEMLDPILLYKVIDGCGYYDGIFRQRFSISAHNIPPEFSSPYLTGYDQGIGRALYYISKGDIQKLSIMVDSFPVSRHADLWRGIGMACIYVGGCDEKMLTGIAVIAGQHQIQLCVGAALVAQARYDAGSITSFVESACTTWCRCGVQDVVALVEKAATAIPHGSNEYQQWIHAIAAGLTYADASRM